MATGLTLLKLQISKDAYVERQACAIRAVPAEAVELLQTSVTARNKGDAVRVALTYILREHWSRFQANGCECRAIAASPKDQRGLHIQVHVQARSTEGVSYSHLVAGLDEEDGEIYNTGGPASEKYGQLCAALRPSVLEAFGQDHLFENDVRRLAVALLEARGAIRLWPGIYLATAGVSAQMRQAVVNLLLPLSVGTIAVHALSMEETQANRQMLAEELAQQFASEYERLEGRCHLVKPSLKAIGKELEALDLRIAQAESVLGLEIPCLTVVLAAEKAYSTACAEETQE